MSAPAIFPICGDDRGRTPGIRVVPTVEDCVGENVRVNVPDGVNMPDDSIARATARYQQAQLSPAEFELFVASLFESLASTRALSELQIKSHEVIRGVDGAYDFDATVRFDAAWMEFLILVEAKCHRNPIKRELVQVLHQKLPSVGAQKPS